MEARASCRIERHDSGYVITLRGSATLTFSPAFREFVGQSLDQGLRVVVDLDECAYLDSTFLGCLIGLHKQSLITGGRRFLLVADESCRMQLLAASGLHHLFDFIEFCPETTGDYVTLETGELDKESLGMHVMQAHRLLARHANRDTEKYRAIADRLQDELEQGPACN